MNRPVGKMRREMAEYLQEFTRNESGGPLSDADALEIVDNLLEIIKETL